MPGLEGKVAIVTGAGRGIGKTVARALANRGMLVGINDYDPNSADAVAKEIVAAGGRALNVPCNVAKKDQVSAMVASVESKLGPLWLLVNNAGVFNSGPTDELSEEDWDHAFAVDAKGVFLCSQAAIKVMMPRRQGRIVNFSSIAGLIVRTKQIAYCAAKAAVVHFSRCLAVEMAPAGITVNCLCPGMTETKMLLDSAVDRGLDLPGMKALIPAGRMAREEDHANMVCFFAAEESGHVTGQVIAVDGGQSLYHPLTLTPRN